MRHPGNGAAMNLFDERKGAAASKPFEHRTPIKPHAGQAKCGRGLKYAYAIGHRNKSSPHQDSFAGRHRYALAVSQNVLTYRPVEKRHPMGKAKAHYNSRMSKQNEQYSEEEAERLRLAV
jgi:hypothetical protein